MRCALVFIAMVVAIPAFAGDGCQIWGARKCASVIEEATPVVRTLPEYPPIARRLRKEGVLRVHVDINERGEVVSVVPADESSIFQSAAVQAAWQWHFKPARINHRSVSSFTTLTFRFVVPEAF